MVRVVRLEKDRQDRESMCDRERVCVCVYVCVFQRDRENMLERQTDKPREKGANLESSKAYFDHGTCDNNLLVTPWGVLSCGTICSLCRHVLR